MLLSTSKFFFQNVPEPCENEDTFSIIRDLEEKLDAKTRAHEKGCKTIQLLLMKTRDLDAEIERLKYQVNLKHFHKSFLLNQTH